jgi:hypothetical protein
MSTYDLDLDSQQPCQIGTLDWYIYADKTPPSLDPSSKREHSISRPSASGSPTYVCVLTAATASSPFIHPKLIVTCY